MDIDKLAEAIMERIEFDRAIHKSSLVEVIQRAMQPSWNPTMPNMVSAQQARYSVNEDRMVFSDGTNVWEGVVEVSTPFNPKKCTVTVGTPKG